MTLWIDAFPLTALEPGRAKVFKRGPDQVAVFRLEGEQAGLHAVDNRCPHEGYPLAQGVLNDCTLTCSWHNFKFDLRDGACLRGDEAVRSYPVRIVDGRVEVDLTPPDPAVAIAAMWRSFLGALRAGRLGQGVRDAARLLAAGVAPEQLAGALAADNGVRAEYGASHVLALSTDVLRWGPRYPGPRFAVPLAQVIDLAVRDAQLREPRHAVEAVDPGSDPVAAGVRFRDAVESEDAAAAEGLLLGALDRGWARAELEPWFFAVCADHFLSFGHRLIYQIKAFDLLEATGWEHAAGILRGHLYGIVHGTREDVLPAWSGFRRALGGVDLDALFGSAGADPGWDGRDPLVAVLTEKRATTALAAVVQALQAGAPVLRVIDAISLAAAERLLRFDVSIDSDPCVQDTWLSVTHTQTFAHAVRHAVVRFDRAEVLPLVLQAAWFVSHHRVLDGEVDPVVSTSADWEATVAAVQRGDVAAALGGVTALLHAEADLTSLREALMDWVITDRYSAPIVSAHAMKNLVVAFEELEIMADPRSLLGAVRLLASPVQQRWTHRTALEAVAFVAEGKTPKVLAP